MRKWNFKMKTNPKEVASKLESELGSIKSFVFLINGTEDNSFTFKVRKRILFAWYLIFHNHVSVKGNLSKSKEENGTNVNISFDRHLLTKAVILTYLFIGLCWTILLLTSANNSFYMYLVGGIALAVGIILWLYERKVFDNKVEEYRTLISGILKAK
ncbi:MULTISPECIES: DUF423 domain-containing protein [unclassified Cellulophaga]|uniref:DUF423 domain-containing protein n=1 Tax=unclassified Cellulophaga TaxID=2634405 RepID=UPI0026E29D0E|nr:MULTISPECIES: DUF423 domain-containing protein [unclassified Cellulophaga]MDO6489874.1 DUF423 domain-containing protein [Cellulophaga sp. 2_MG-2023]MDO6494932.1 DUF423 domain-containing protein [Cellulophaga sp. 3_MG-2023]